MYYITLLISLLCVIFSVGVPVPTPAPTGGLMRVCGDGSSCGTVQDDGTCAYSPQYADCEPVQDNGGWGLSFGQCDGKGNCNFIPVADGCLRYCGDVECGQFSNCNCLYSTKGTPCSRDSDGSIGSCDGSGTCLPTSFFPTPMPTVQWCGDVMCATPSEGGDCIYSPRGMPCVGELGAGACDGQGRCRGLDLDPATDTCMTPYHDCDDETATGDYESFGQPCENARSLFHACDSVSIECREKAAPNRPWDQIPGASVTLRFFNGTIITQFSNGTRRERMTTPGAAGCSCVNAQQLPGGRCVDLEARFECPCQTPCSGVYAGWSDKVPGQCLVYGGRCETKVPGDAEHTCLGVASTAGQGIDCVSTFPPKVDLLQCPEGCKPNPEGCKPGQKLPADFDWDPNIVGELTKRFCDCDGVITRPPTAAPTVRGLTPSPTWPLPPMCEPGRIGCPCRARTVDGRTSFRCDEGVCSTTVGMCVPSVGQDPCYLCAEEFMSCSTAAAFDSSAQCACAVSSVDCFQANGCPEAAHAVVGCQQIAGCTECPQLAEITCAQCTREALRCSLKAGMVQDAECDCLSRAANCYFRYGCSDETVTAAVNHCRGEGCRCPTPEPAECEHAVQDFADCISRARSATDDCRCSLTSIEQLAEHSCKALPGAVSGCSALSNCPCPDAAGHQQQQGEQPSPQPKPTKSSAATVSAALLLLLSTLTLAVVA